MGDPVIERITKRQKLKLMWQVSALYSKPLPFLLNRVEEIRLFIKHIKLETTMMQRFMGDNQLDIPIEISRSNTEVSSETSQSISTDNPIASTALTLMVTYCKRTKKVDINFEQKFNIAKNYMNWMMSEMMLKRWITNAYIIEQIDSIENQDLTARTIQNEINFLLSRVGPAVCFAKLKPGNVPGRDRQISTERFWAIAFVKDTKYDQSIRGTKLDNIILLQQIKKLGAVYKYQEQVDVAEFYRKLLENRSFPNEIEQLTKKRVELMCRTSLKEREMYNMRRHLEKRVSHGDKLRRRIATVKHLIGQVEQSLANAVAARDKEKNTKEKWLTLFSDYGAPRVDEYFEMISKNKELEEIVKVWEKRVALAKLVNDTNQQKWRRLTKQGALMVWKRNNIQEQYTLFIE